MVRHGKLSLVLIFAVAFSCERSAVPRVEPGKEVTAMPGTENAPAAGRGPAPLPQTAPTAAPERAGQAAPSEAGGEKEETGKALPKAPPKLPANARAADALLLYRPTRRFSPEDLKLGPLARGDDREPLSAAAQAAAAAFMDGVIAGRPAASVIASDVRPMLVDLLSASLASAPKATRYRLAAAVPLGEGAYSANVRIYSADGRAEGELVMEREKGATWVTAFLVDLADMALPAANAEPFEPETYRAFYP
ncbi:MAG: hypothetical protein NT080_13005 [Spirochaetes bacterium]|nr:hypothetical protein [Spirochaetota bacterium]